MINPYKIYNARGVYTITEFIYPREMDICRIVCKDLDGNTFEGYLNDLTKRPNRFNIGDKVKIGCQFSIVLDKFLIKSIRKLRK